MSAYDDAFHVLEDNRWLRFRRDVRLLLWLAGFLVLYLTVGTKMRRAYREHRRLGQPLFID